MPAWKTWAKHLHDLKREAAHRREQGLCREIMRDETGQWAPVYYSDTIRCTF